MDRFYLIGGRLGHSWSAEIHRAFGRYNYELLELSPAELGPFLKAREFAGLNVTIPCKEAVIPFLDRLDPAAAAIGAVNTIVNRDGVLWGYNTDFGGLRASLERLCAAGAAQTSPACRASKPVERCRQPEATGTSAFSAESPVGSRCTSRTAVPGATSDAFGPLWQQATGFSQKTVVILGTGGTSKTALAVCRALGAARILRVSRTGREGALTYEQAVALFEGPPHPSASQTPSPQGEGSGTSRLILVNCTPVGTWPNNDETPWSLTRCQGPSCVFDCVYNPLRTRLVLEARARGGAAMGGLYMLVKQAALACELFTGTPVEDEQVDIIYNSLRREQENLVLIGMPGAGKTTVGRILAQKTGREFVDSDEEIVNHAGKTISAIFAADGEAAFRDLEAEVLREAASKPGRVISVGGGAILREENLRRLRQTGRLILLDRSLEALVPTPDRPLGDTAEKLRKLYIERYPIYRAAADLTVPVAATVEDTADAILTAL